MTDQSTSKPPVWFWIISIVALLWNATGVYQYLIKAYNTEGFRSQYTAEQLEVIANAPAWSTAAFAIGVFGGLIACGFLLLRRKLATTFFVFSLIGILVQAYHNHVVINSGELMGSTAPIMTAVVAVIGLLLLYFTKVSTKKGWIS
ncbi:hypothetical protein [Psychroserpens sp.]|uniref:hypothetical protein n=1 Tax=Psychroserpens sp. TaxID=2020870 RepID=UPI001B2AE155|nr:hypothetical protein [Psychroserpens sp.]MBO6606432.1 hypothetical protein [Psychroserpens sp.]MBO6653136.1 hypothetical protein [Psychroserpens sp.]MBO6680836.1 hypothetical protein [Psychroserpens sp.]MBO6750206.1 hypothetical protein [Psychroserpens sp.]MBO6914687.1 hypothetical protein [Psychroserpens sp.]